MIVSQVRRFLSTLSLRRATNADLGRHRGNNYFYPRSPCGERLDTGGNDNGNAKISIHALLAESDNTCVMADLVSCEFLSTLSLRRATGCVRYCIRAREISIHALLAESDCRWTSSKTSRQIFLSTLSLRRATNKPTQRAESQQFLSTLSLRRATAKVHKTVGHFCAYETNFMEIASSC